MVLACFAILVEADPSGKQRKHLKYIVLTKQAIYTSVWWLVNKLFPRKKKVEIWCLLDIVTKKTSLAVHRKIEISILVMRKKGYI